MVPPWKTSTEYNWLFWVGHEPHGTDAPLLKLMSENYLEGPFEAQKGKFIKTVTFSHSTQTAKHSLSTEFSLK